MSGKETIIPLDLDELPEDIKEIMEKRIQRLKDNFEPLKRHDKEDDLFLGILLSYGEHVLSYPPEELLGLLQFVDSVREGWHPSITPEIVAKSAAELEEITKEEWLEITGDTEEKWAYAMLSTLYSGIALGILTPGANLAIYLINTSGDKTFINMMRGPTDIVKH